MGGAWAPEGVCISDAPGSEDESQAGAGAGQVTGALFYVRLMQSSPGDGLPGRYDHSVLIVLWVPALAFRAMIPVPGSGAAREPFFAEGVQAAVVDCVLLQWFESVHSTVRAPAWSCAAGISGAEDGAGGCSPAGPAGDES